MSDVGRYRRLYTRLWRHPGFVELTEGEKNLAIYIITGPQSNRLGLYVFSIATAAEDLGTLPQTITKRLVRVCQTFGWLFDSKARVMYIASWFKWNPPENPNVMRGSLKDLNEIPPCALVDAFAANIETLPETLRETFLEGLRQRLPKRLPNQEAVAVPVSHQEQKPSALRAVALKDENKSHPEIDNKLLAIAREVVRVNPKNTDTDVLIDHVQYLAREQRLETTRATVISAISKTQEGRISA